MASLTYARWHRASQAMCALIKALCEQISPLRLTHFKTVTHASCCLVSDGIASYMLCRELRWWAKAARAVS